MKFSKACVFSIAAFFATMCFFSLAYAEKLKMTGSNKSERTISQSVMNPGDSPGHMLMQTATMSKTTSSNPDWNDIMMVDYQQADQLGENGSHVGYGYHKHKNGDQTFFKYWGKQKATSDGKTSSEGKFEWTGGTGKFKNVKGGGTYTCSGDATAQTCDWQAEGEY